MGERNCIIAAYTLVLLKNCWLRQQPCRASCMKLQIEFNLPLYPVGSA